MTMTKTMPLAGVMALVLIVATPQTAAADPVAAASASAYGVSAAAGGQGVIPPTPSQSSAVPPGEDNTETLVNVPASPVAISGTFTATATAHVGADVASALTVAAQPETGPYNATGVAQVEGLAVAPDSTGPDVSLVSAGVIRAEAAAVCSSGQPRYSANSEIVDLTVAGTPVPANGPLEDLVDAINVQLQQTGLNAAVEIERNVVTPVARGGIAVDALVITVLATAGETPLAEVRIAHAEVGPVTCLTDPVDVVKDGPDIVSPGTSFDYTITVTNTACPTNADLVRVTDTVEGPPGAAVTATQPAASSVAGSTATGGIVVIWDNPGTLDPGASAVFTITIVVPDDAPDGADFIDTVSADLTCAGTSYQDTDRIERPRVRRPEILTGVVSPPVVPPQLALTGGNSSDRWLLLGSAGSLLGTLVLRSLRRPAANP